MHAKRHVFALVLVLLVVGWMTARDDHSLVSGPQATQRLPGSFNPLIVRNVEYPQASGKKWDLVEQHDAKPVVLIFVRQINDPVATLANRIDAEVSKRKAGKLKGVLILLANDFDQAEMDLARIVHDERTKNISLGIEKASGPKAYRLSPDAEVTAILYKKYRVHANHSFRKLNAAGIDAIINDVSKMLSAPQSLDFRQIGTAVGTKATEAPDGVVRIAWARNDVAVQVDGMPLKPFAGLGSWAAFTPSPHGAMVMGDTVVFQDEVTPAIDAAFSEGLEITGLHNHFFYDEPKVYFMHIGGQGPPEKLAAAVKKVWDAIKRVRAERPQPATRFPGEVPRAGTLTASVIEGILGHKSQTQDGVVKVTIGRAGSMHGVKVGGSMGLTTWAAFSGSDELAAVDGDFIMTAEEVQPVLRALRKTGIHIVALHNHMVGEQPAFYFTHFWGKGKSKELAKALKTALDAQAETSKESH